MPGGDVPNGPPGISRSTLSVAYSVNQRLPSGPTVIPRGRWEPADRGYSAATPVAGSTRTTSLAELDSRVGTYMNPSGPSTTSRVSIWPALPAGIENSVTFALDVAELGKRATLLVPSIVIQSARPAPPPPSGPVVIPCGRGLVPARANSVGAVPPGAARARRPMEPPASSVNQIAPSGPCTMSTASCPAASGNDVTTPAGVIFPMASEAANQRLPSDALVIPRGSPIAGMRANVVGVVLPGVGVAVPGVSRSI